MCEITFESYDLIIQAHATWNTIRALSARTDIVQLALIRPDIVQPT